MDEITCTFEFDRETKGTRRFAEVEVPGQPPVVGTLYVKKHVCHNMGNPTRLTVTIHGS